MERCLVCHNKGDRRATSVKQPLTKSGQPRRFTIWSTAACLLTLAALPAIFGNGSAAEARRDAAATASLAVEQENSAPRGIAAYVPTGAPGQGDDGILEGV